MRDYTDVAEILLDGRWSPEDVIAMGAGNDPGLSRAAFAQVLDPKSSRFPESEDFRDMGFDTVEETLMRHALAVLRSTACGEAFDSGALLTARKEYSQRVEGLGASSSDREERPVTSTPRRATGLRGEG